MTTKTSTTDESREKTSKKENKSTDCTDSIQTTIETSSSPSPPTHQADKKLNEPKRDHIQGSRKHHHHHSPVVFESIVGRVFLKHTMSKKVSFWIHSISKRKEWAKKFNLLSSRPKQDSGGVNGNSSSLELGFFESD